MSPKSLAISSVSHRITNAARKTSPGKCFRENRRPTIIEMSSSNNERMDCSSHHGATTMTNTNSVPATTTTLCCSTVHVATSSRNCLHRSCSSFAGSFFTTNSARLRHCSPSTLQQFARTHQSIERPRGTERWQGPTNDCVRRAREDEPRRRDAGTTTTNDERRTTTTTTTTKDLHRQIRTH